jgi:hypothetical protein
MLLDRWETILQDGGKDVHRFKQYHPPFHLFGFDFRLLGLTRSIRFEDLGNIYFQQLTFQ